MKINNINSLLEIKVFSYTYEKNPIDFHISKRERGELSPCFRFVPHLKVVHLSPLYAYRIERGYK